MLGILSLNTLFRGQPAPCSPVYYTVSQKMSYYYYFFKYCFVFEHFQSKMSMRAEERGVYMKNISRMFRKPWGTKNYSVSSIELVLLPAVCLLNSLSGTE